VLSETSVNTISHTELSILTVRVRDWFVPPVHFVKRGRVLNDQYIPISSLNLDLLTSKSMGLIYHLGCTSVLSLKYVKQRVLKMLSGQYILMSSLALDLLTSKSIGLICYLRCISVLSLKFVKQRVLKIFDGQNIPISSVNRP
jgi:hypothetical protein